VAESVQVGSARCLLMEGGSTIVLNGNGDTVFVVRKGGRTARMQQWWGNTDDRLVLRVHTGKKINSYANYKNQKS